MAYCSCIGPRLHSAGFATPLSPSVVCRAYHRRWSHTGSALLRSRIHAGADGASTPSSGWILFISAAEIVNRYGRPAAKGGQYGKLYGNGHLLWWVYIVLYPIYIYAYLLLATEQHKPTLPLPALL